MAGAASGPRSIAIVGPYLSGKTTLLESILFVAGAIGRKGKVSEGSSVGDSSQEAREREMGVEINTASAEYLGDRFTFLDCPGSIEFSQESLGALIDDTMPAQIRQKEPLDFGKPMSEREVLEYMRVVAGKNKVLTSLIGQGYHGTVTPPAIQRNIFENAECVVE